MHQIIRAATPALTALLLRLLFPSKRYSYAAYLSLALTVLGVILATKATSGEYEKFESLYGRKPSLSWWSSCTAPRSAVFLTILGAVLASLKSIATSQMQKLPLKASWRKGNRTNMFDGLGLNSLELVTLVSPLAFLQSLCLALATGECSKLVSFTGGSINDLAPCVSRADPDPEVHAFIGTIPCNYAVATMQTIFLLVLNLSLALALNIASFEANRRCGALGINLAANIKQVIIVALAAISAGGSLHHDYQRNYREPRQTLLGWIRGFGVMGTIVGSWWFAVEEGKRLQGPRQRQKQVRYHEHRFCHRYGRVMDKKSRTSGYV